MAGKLTPDDLQQVLEFLQSVGDDYEPILIAPTTPEDWTKIIILVRDKRTDTEIPCNIDMKTVLDTYGGNVEELGKQVQLAVDQILQDKTFVSETAEQVSKDKDSIQKLVDEITGTLIPHIDQQKEAVDQAAATATEKAAEAEKKAGEAFSSASASASSASASAASLAGTQEKVEEAKAIYDQILALGSQTVEEVILIESTLYKRSMYVKRGRIYEKLEKVEVTENV